MEKTIYLMLNENYNGRVECNEWFLNERCAMGFRNCIYSLRKIERRLMIK